jgi:ankyrin repeat protein
LHYACEYQGKETAALKYLVYDVELEVDHCDQIGQTPFHVASIIGNVDLLKILYNRKPGVAMAKDKVDRFYYFCFHPFIFFVFSTGRSALHYACEYEGEEDMKESILLP